MSFSDAEFRAKRKVTRRERFLADMERAIPWKVFADLVEPHYPKAGNVHDVTQAHALLHGEEERVLGDTGYRGVHKREENLGRNVQWHIAMRPGKRRTLGKGNMGRMLESYERAKASLRSRVEHPFRVIKRQFGFTKVRYRGLAKNTAQLTMLFMLANLWKVRHHLMAVAG